MTFDAETALVCKCKKNCLEIDNNVWIEKQIDMNARFLISEYSHGQ